ncbi:Stress-associated endoplasmic reticulum protein [Caenorhabditis elegans]|uniref:Stress-associated endoplasmic reticulum protein n=1 Tax=Caenorhabditis elegans TaxID=6239 RepID=A0A0K3AS38_CAEEL|nr:Stress-associated endoplasmic reticulum protein [Caenorhabditis elegans]CTQ86684.1 Stress-associated endoplasmic reticulum protein [Caenorhabditis elegans]|eukprot:NP_001299983.1 Uncharacterized protein CELE_Y116A8C.470 [Caenorhabditis elegans]
MAHVKPNKTTTTRRAKSMTTRHQIESTTQTSPSSQLGFLAGLALCVLSALNFF